MARTPRRRDGSAATPAPGGEAATRRARENLPRPAAAPRPVAPAGEKAAPARRSRGPFSFLSRFQPRFVADIIAELRKVTWPTFEETRYLTFVVAVVSLAVGLLLGGVDLFFGWIIERIFF